MHNCYGDELGLTSDDEDYIDPNENRGGEDEKAQPLNNHAATKSADSVSEDHSETHSDATSNKNSEDTTRHKQKVIPKSEVAAAALSTTIAPKLSHRKIISRKRGDDNLMGTTVEHLPTDMSDSSDSESNNIPFVSTAECTSMHEGRQFVHTILPINVDTLFSLLFSKSKFLVDFHNIRKTTNMIHEDWCINEENQKYRKVTLTIALTQAVGPKCSHVNFC